LKIHSYKTNNFFPSGVIFGGYLILVVSVAIIFVNAFIGTLFLLLSLLIVSGNEGVSFNFPKKKLRYYWRIFGLKFGKWEKIPPLEKINIVPVTKTTQASSYSGKIAIFKAQKYQIRLYYSEYNDYILAFEGNYKHAKAHVAVFSRHLKLKVFDYSKGNGKALK